MRGLQEMHDWPERIERLVQSGQVNDADVAQLRALVWSEGQIARPVIDDLFLINDNCAPQSHDWRNFFVEAVEHYLLRQKFPHGFIHEPDAAWLRTSIQTNGAIGSAAELDLLVNVIEAAENAPDDLKDFAIAEIERIAVSGVGVTRIDDGDIRPRSIDASEVSLLRRLIFAGGGEGAIVVGSKEADMLLRLKAATLDGDNAPEWMELFVQGVGNHLLAHSDYRPLSRDEAARLNREMDHNAPNVANFFKRMIPGEMFGRGTLVEAFKAVFPAKPLPSSLQHGDAASALTSEEADWLKDQIVLDAQTDAYEKALLAFIIDEVGNLPPVLNALLKRA
jgi:hypothetical protein